MNHQSSSANISMRLFHFDPKTHEPSLLIFGYGSLIWNPGFEHEGHTRALLPGYARRFWHGTFHHRGTREQPGRVVTIVPEADGVVTGMIYRVRGIAQINAALKHLQYREIDNGYQYESVSVVEQSTAGGQAGQRRQVLTCVGDPTAEDWVGEADELAIAAQIATAQGVAGRNSEYALKLAEAHRSHFPHIHDSHLHTIEQQLTELIVAQA